ncbi:MAG: peptide chain release factor N(5)-glutamine methyltransferase, partial [Clostridia bacterium]|nr:peptide chain release factor N(5)-glutamine methyltransferase [Clostridia bacterium]
MTYAELYRRVCEKLAAAGCDSPDFDASCLLTDIGGMPRGVPGVDFGNINAEAEAAVWAAAEQRAAGRPLQYILGQWDFLALTLEVGEGVLIPRPDTECLCEAAAEWLNRHAAPGAAVIDLCAGSGCVGLGVASLCRVPLQVTAVELSDDALPYLQKNIARYPQYNVTAVQADVLAEAAKFPGPYTAILSNPPYIPTGDLPGLQREVLREPHMALDGEADGLRFYRAIAT